MRRINALALGLACLALPSLAAARPLSVHVGVPGGVRAEIAGAMLVREGLLTPAQLACTDLVPERLGSARVSHVALYQVHGGRCPGAPQPPTYRTDVYVDLVSGVVDTTPESKAELVTVLPGEPIIR